MKTIAELREEGYKVGVKHSRAFTWDDKKKETDLVVEDVFFLTKREFVESYQDLESDVPRLLQSRGKTTITITTPDGVTVEGNSSCWFREDSYNRKLGVKVALGRALQALERLEGVH